MSRMEVRAKLRNEAADKSTITEELVQLHQMQDNRTEADILTVSVGCGGVLTLVCCE